MFRIISTQTTRVVDISEKKTQLPMSMQARLSPHYVKHFRAEHIKSKEYSHNPCPHPNLLPRHIQ